MMEIGENEYPDVYVMSKLPNIYEELRNRLPSHVKVIRVPVSDKRLKYDKSVTVRPEEIEMLQDAEIVIIDSMLLSKVLYKLPKVKWAQSTWTGVEMIFDSVIESKPKPQFLLTRYVEPYLGELMANYVVAQIINIERGLHIYSHKQKEKKWARPFFPDFRVVSDLTIGVLGAGELGSTVGKQLASLGAKVIFYVKNLKNHKNSEHTVYTTRLSTVLESCDYLCNVLPSANGTIGLLDGAALKQCRRKPVFINIGRGDIISENTITEALNNGWISLAILDVFDEEPLPMSSCLWDHPSVMITPHIGAIPHVCRSAKLIAENYNRYVKGSPLLNEVDWNKGY